MTYKFDITKTNRHEIEEEIVSGAKERTMNDIKERIQNNGIQCPLSDGQVWTLTATSPDASEYELIRRYGGYEQYKESYSDIGEAMRSAAEIAPLDQWIDADW